MEIFYTSDIAGGILNLGEEESQHCIKVLRHRAGDEISVIDGEGTLFRCRIISDSAKGASAEILESFPDWGGHPYHLEMAVCPTKNMDRYEWFAEKACEIGLDSIVPVIGEHSERKVLKPQRLEKILLSATKQSLKGRIPQLKEAVSVKDYIGSFRDVPDRMKLIAYCFEDDSHPRISIRQALADMPEKCQGISVLIGPEGDFSAEEAALAMECGFSVSVKEIPVGDGNTKNDPDSYCTNRTRFKDLEEVDFITWYAGYAFKADGTTEDKSSAVTKIAQMVAMVGDDVKEQMYLEQLKKIYNHGKLWQTAINREKQKISESKADKTKTINRDLLAKYGFFESNNCYYSTNDGKEFQWSNFVMQPMFHIKDSLNPKRLYRIRNQNKQEEIVEMKQEDLVSLSKFKQKVEGLGNYIWLATEKEMTRLKMYLYEQTETAVEITQLGWQRKGFYAFGNGVFDTEWHPVDEYGIVRLADKGNYYLPASSMIYRDDDKLFQFERRFVHLNYSGISMKEYFTKLVAVFGDNAKVGICFLLATLFRDVITGYTKSFPILNLFGPKGSGKSELGHSLMSLFIIDNTPPNIQNATIPALAELVAQCSNALVHIDEFKNNIDIDKREYLKGLWDGAGRSRINMDRDKKREITAVDSGVILSGQEMATADIALFSRLVFLTFSKSEFSDAEKKRYSELVDIRKRGLSHLTLLILRHRAKMEQQFVSNYHSCLSDIIDGLGAEKVEDRILRNWIIPLAAFRTLEGVLDLPFSYQDIRKVTLEGIVRQNAECKSNNELANFWNVVSFLQQDGEIFIEGDYRIEYVNKFKSNLIKIEQLYQEPKAVLLMRRNRIFMLYKKFGKQVGDSVLPEGSLNYYLENSKEYMGKKNSVRFKNIQNGVEVQKAEQTGTGGIAYRKTSTPDIALCFDYKMIRDTYNINLEVEVEGRETTDDELD